MIGGRIIKPTPVLKEGPAAIAEKVLTAVADWRAAEPPAAEATTAPGTVPVSNVATFSENKTRRASRQHTSGHSMAITKNIIHITPDQTVFNTHSPVNDSRASKRFDHEAHLIIKNCDCGSYAYGRMYNYSRGGIYFESDRAFKPGSCLRVDIEDSTCGPAADHYYATVMWCKEIEDAVVLHEFGIGIEFDRTMNRSGGGGKLRIVQGGACHKAI